MKFKNRLLLTLGLAVIVFSCVAFYTRNIWKSRHDLDPSLDLGSVRRSLNMAESSSRELPGLIGQILEQPARESHILKALVRNQTMADAWIKVGHILEQQKQSRNQVVVSVEDPRYHGAGIGTNGAQKPGVQDTQLMDKAAVSELVNILYKILGYSSSHRKQHKLKEPLKMYKEMKVSQRSSSSLQFQAGISRYSLYSNDTVVDHLLEDMASQTIIDTIQMDGGTQLKLKFTLADRTHTVFKPMRYPREIFTLPNHFYFSDYERHIAEIAAFHLDRVLDFRKVPPVVGRVVNITQDIWRFAGKNKKFEKTFFISPVGNVCFHGKCDYYCDTGHAICGKPELLEGSMATFLPPSDQARRNRWRHPWRRSYSKRKIAKWEEQADYCDGVRQMPPYNDTKRMLDLMDIAVFDFLTGNMDRHHYETFLDYTDHTFTLLFDNGRGFGKPYLDEMTILAPMYQCCMIRASTLHKLLVLHTGDTKLSELMKRSLAHDPLPDVLIQPHLVALDRRVDKILKVVSQCVSQKHDYHDVILDDHF